MSFTTATVKIGDPLRDEWTNVGVLIYDNSLPDCPLVAQRFVTDWERVSRRTEDIDLPPDELRDIAHEYPSMYQTYERVKRGGYPGSFVQVHEQGASVYDDAQRVCESFYRHCCYDPEFAAAWDAEHRPQRAESAQDAS